MNNDVKRFVDLLNTDCACVSIVTQEEREAVEVVRLGALELKRKMVIWSVSCGVREGIFADGPPEANTSNPAAGLYKMGLLGGNTISVVLDMAGHLRDELCLRLMREVIERYDQNGSTIVMVDSVDILPAVVKSYAKSFELSLPDEKELEEIVRGTVRAFHGKKPIDVGITKGGLEAVVKNLRGLTRRQARSLVTEVIAEDLRFDDDDVVSIMVGKRRLMRGESLLEYVETPLSLDEIGGMKNLKRWLGQRKNAFTEEAREFGIGTPRGVLLLGVQGAGKSLCAKATATAWQQPLMRLDAGRLYDSYIGQSERNLRQAFRQAEFMSPVILWIDEIEKAFASAASRSVDGGLSQRMFGSLLTWMQEHDKPVFLVATANDIDALPAELLRKGRFDEIFFVGLPNKEAREKIFEIHLRRRGRESGGFDVDGLADASEGFSGAEIEQAIEGALHGAFAAKKDLTTERIMDALRDSVPLSVTMAEKVEWLCEWAKGRCVPAD